MRCTLEPSYRSFGCGERLLTSLRESVSRSRKFLVVLESPGEGEMVRCSRGSVSGVGGRNEVGVSAI